MNKLPEIHKWQRSMQMKSFRSQQRRPMTKKQKRDYYMAMIRNNFGWKVKDFKGITFEEIEAKFAKVWKQEHVKKQKTSEEAPEIKKSTEEISEEKMKEMMQLGRIVGNKMHKAFPLLVRKFPLPEGTSHYLKMNATVRRIQMPLPEVCTAIEEKKKKLPVKDRW
nr:hypothetical protein [Tanacetum cinerariifolium]